MKNHPQPGRAKVRLEVWLMLLLLPVHPEDLRGLVLEKLILLGEVSQRPGLGLPTVSLHAPAEPKAL